MNKLEVKEKLKDNKLPEGWKITNLADTNYFKIVGSGIEFFKGNKNYLSTNSVQRTRITHIEENITYFNRPSRANIQPTKNRIAFAKMRNSIKVLYINEKLEKDYILSTGFSLFEVKIYPKYFYQYVMSCFFNHQKDLLAEGTTQEAISNDDFKRIYISFSPSISEQCKIAEILETVDETIEKTDAIIEKYKRIKQGLMQDLLTRGIDENGQIRSEETYKFKDSSLGRIPEKWEVKRIIDAIGVKRNLIIAGPFGSNLKVSDYKKSGIPLIRLQNIEENKFINKDIKYISKKKAKELYYHSFKNGDIVLAKLGIPVGKTCIIPKNLKFGIVVADVVRIRVFDECADKEFITYILNFNTCRKRLNMEIIGTTRPRVNLTQIRSLQLPLPPLPEQQRIAGVLSQIDETIEKEQKYKEKLERIKQGLMEDLLTGKVRVNRLFKEGVESV